MQLYQRIKVSLGLSEIAKLEKVEVSDEDLEAEYKNLSDMYGMPVEEIKKYILDSELKADLKTRKALDVIKK